jgi:hypothetical protein
LCKRQIAEFIEHGEVLAGEVIGHSALSAIARLCLEAVDQIDDVKETAACAAANATARNRDRQMGLSGASSADQHDISLLGKEAAGGKIADQCLIDWRALEVEVCKVLGEWQLGNGELLDRARLFLGNLRLEELTDDPLRFVAPFQAVRHDFAEGSPACQKASTRP